MRDPEFLVPLLSGQKVLGQVPSVTLKNVLPHLIAMTDAHGHDTPASSHDEHGDKEHEAPSEPHGAAHDLAHGAVHEEESGSLPIPLSVYTKALVKSWTTHDSIQPTSPHKISVSQTVSFAAFLYEKMRNAVEFREDHLIRRAAIARILKRRMILNENGRDIAEPLIKELLWARYLENNTIGEEKIGQLQSIIDKYFFIRNELSVGRKGGEQEKIREFVQQVLSCEIEEVLNPSEKREAFTNYVYQILRPNVSKADFDSEVERDTQVYIAVERAFAHSDDAMIRYHLLKLMIPEITKVNWKTAADSLLPSLYAVYKDIEKALNHPFTDKVRNTIKKQIASFLILRDIFEQNSHSIEAILSDETKLKHKVDEVCRKRYDESGGRLRRTAIRSFIYILLTKVILAMLIELPYDQYVLHQISYFPIIVNVVFPPLLMTLIILTVQVPGDDNTRRIFQQIKSTLVTDPEKLAAMQPDSYNRRRRSRSLIFYSLFTTLYFLTYLVTFGAIIYVLNLLNFSFVSEGIFIFFVTLITFFAFKVIMITQEYQVIASESILSPITDFIFLPILRVGQWLSGEVLSRFNVLIFIFDFVIEMPFKAIVEVFDEWVHFVRLKKEEIM